MWVNGQCAEGPCRLAKDFPDDCKATPYCAFQLPHGMQIKRDYHRKVDEECVFIDERLGLSLQPPVEDFTDYTKIDINKFCAAATKRRDCLRKRFVAYPERLRFQLEENVCQWNYNQEVCRVNRVGAQYGQIVNITATTLRQENPGYVITDSRKPPKNRDFKKPDDNFYDNWDEYNNMCLNVNDEEEVLGGGCEERGCALFFDETKYDVTTQKLCPGCDAVYCVPRYPADDKYGIDPYGADVWDGPGTDARFNFTDDIDTRDNWIGYLACETISPQYCNSVPGCNAKRDVACSKNGATCYVCVGSPELGGKRRRMDVTELLMDYLSTREVDSALEMESDSAGVLDLSDEVSTGISADGTLL